MSHAPPAGPPPSSNNPFTSPADPPPSTAAAASNPAADDDAPLNDPPPAYTPSASMAGATTVDAGPSRMDFSGPPPMPDRMQSQPTGMAQNVTGVGVGFGHGGGHHVPPQSTGGWGAPAPPSQQAMSPVGTGYQPPPLPPRHPSTAGTGAGASGGAGPSSSNGGAAQDLSPTEVPTPGRPLLYKGQLLVYPKGFWCHKCGNTGFKANDPSNPHDTDWRKYGKPYTSVLAHSYKTSSTNHPANPSTNSSDNFQRPLPSFNSPAGPGPSSHYQQQQQPNHNPYGNLPPPPGGKWNTYPGQTAPPPPPMHHQPYMQQPMQGQQVFVQSSRGPVPPGALVVGPGDPRIGGRLCWRCSGSGRELSFFGFDDGRCWECRGLGRLFR
ncbi:hypothetical protein IAT38_004429 [Cryptococcus sp. DSM 104549]